MASWSKASQEKIVLFRTNSSYFVLLHEVAGKRTRAWGNLCRLFSETHQLLDFRVGGRGRGDMALLASCNSGEGVIRETESGSGEGEREGGEAEGEGGERGRN